MITLSAKEFNSLVEGFKKFIKDKKYAPANKIAFSVKAGVFQAKAHTSPVTGLSQELAFTLSPCSGTSDVETFWIGIDELVSLGKVKETVSLKPAEVPEITIGSLQRKFTLWDDKAQEWPDLPGFNRAKPESAIPFAELGQVIARCAPYVGDISSPLGCQAVFLDKANKRVSATNGCILIAQPLTSELPFKMLVPPTPILVSGLLDKGIVWPLFFHPHDKNEKHRREDYENYKNDPSRCDYGSQYLRVDCAPWNYEVQAVSAKAPDMCKVEDATPAEDLCTVDFSDDDVKLVKEAAKMGREAEPCFHLGVSDGHLSLGLVKYHENVGTLVLPGSVVSHPELFPASFGLFIRWFLLALDSGFRRLDLRITAAQQARKEEEERAAYNVKPLEPGWKFRGPMPMTAKNSKTVLWSGNKYGGKAITLPMR